MRRRRHAGGGGVQGERVCALGLGARVGPGGKEISSFFYENSLCRGPASMALGKDALPRAGQPGSRQSPFAESLTRRLSAKNCCLFLFFLNLELSFFLCPCDLISKYILNFGIN